jgi:hypothetical protein
VNKLDYARKLLTDLTRDLPDGGMLFGVPISEFDEPMLRMTVAYLGRQWREEMRRADHDLDFLHGIYSKAIGR